MRESGLSNRHIETKVVSGESRGDTFDALIRTIDETKEGETSTYTVADISITKDGKSPHLFRSIAGVSFDDVFEDVSTALGKLVVGNYLESIAFLNKTDHKESPLRFIELDPETQLELAGANISSSSVARDLGKDGLVNVKKAFDEMLHRIVADPDLLQASLADFESVQQKDLWLINPDTYAKTYPDLSLRPVVIDPFQEEKLSRLVSNVIIAKIAIVNGAINNPELRELFLQEMNDLGREVISANMFPLPKHVRIRIDSHTDFEVGDSSQIETNGSEPQGDAVTSVTLSLLKRTFGRLFQKLGATPEQIENCFRELRLPLYRVADKIVQIYQQNQPNHPDLPTRFNVGFFAWKHPNSRKPLSNISNAESEKSIEFITDNAAVKNGYSFDPFDIVRFETLEDARYHIPIIALQNGEEVPLHFIRRLYSNLSFNAPTWRVLKERSPEIFYKFAGVQNDEWNPEGRRLPEWMWMNPLNPCLTDKVLDAMITDPVLRRRFNLVGLIMEDLRRDDSSLSKNAARRKAIEIISGCEEFIPLTKCLTRARKGLFPGDKGVGGLNEAEIQELKVYRQSWVIKLDSLGGYAGQGIFVGKSFLLGEIPQELFTNLTGDEQDRIKLSIIDTILNSRAELGSVNVRELFERSIEFFWTTPIGTIASVPSEYKGLSLEGLASQIEAQEGGGFLNAAREILWPSLIEFALEQPKSLIQKYKPPQIFNALRLSYDGNPGTGVSLSIPTPHSVDINVFAFGPEQSDFHSRGSQLGKTNITGGYGARMIVIPSNVAESMASLFTNLI